MDFLIGVYSEEAIESFNKECKKARLHHTRKMSRLETMTDQYHYLLMNSDPLMASMRRVKRPKHASLPEEVQEMIIYNEEDDEDEDYEEENNFAI